MRIVDKKPVLDQRVRELASVAASVAANCVPCIEYHYPAALAAGATKEEIQEAISIGRAIRSRPPSHLEDTVRKLLANAESSA